MARIMLVGLVTLLAILPAVLAGNEGTKALLYLSKYGYIEADNGTQALVTEDTIKEYVKSAVKDFQAFAGLNQTGELDPLTVELMGTPRCGVKDMIGHGATARRKKRYVLQGSRWQVKKLTYRINKYPSTFRLTKSQVDETVKKAFVMWQDATDLTFERKDSGNVNIEISFEKYEHGDGDPFDGPGGTLAHAYFPQFGGDVHVDDTEYWSIDSYKGTNLLQTMVHELGHSLGLSHSDVRDAIMAPFYRGWDPNFQLNSDDKRAIQALYGRKVRRGEIFTTARPSIVPQTRPGNICSSSGIDAIVQTADTTSYVFIGAQYWKLTADSVAAGYPRNIAQDWAGLPGNIDAAFTWHKSRATYFLKGSKYWKFENMRPKPGYPKDMKNGFPGIPTGVDAAFVWGGNGKIYFFKGSSYWKFDPERKPHVRSDQYPKPISLWDLPSNMDAALQWDNGRTYFFKSRNYWRFNDRLFTVDRGNPAFPRPTAQWWFGCPATSQFKDGNNIEDAVVSLVKKEEFGIDDSEDENDYVGYDDLEEPIHK